MGLLSSPEDVTLRNNLAFSLASLGEIGAAKGIVAQIIETKATESKEITLTATTAFIKFREGDAEIGRSLYRSAVDRFRQAHDHRGEAIAKFFWTQEERQVNSNSADKLEEEALTAAKKFNLIELLTAAGRTKRQNPV